MVGGWGAWGRCKRHFLSVIIILLGGRRVRGGREGGLGGREGGEGKVLVWVLCVVERGSPGEWVGVWGSGWREGWVWFSGCRNYSGRGVSCRMEGGCRVGARGGVVGNICCLLSSFCLMRRRMRGGIEGGGVGAVAGVFGCLSSSVTGITG